MGIWEGLFWEPLGNLMSQRGELQVSDRKTDSCPTRTRITEANLAEVFFSSRKERNGLQIRANRSYLGCPFLALLVRTGRAQAEIEILQPLSIGVVWWVVLRDMKD